MPVALAPAEDGARAMLRFHQDNLASAEEPERQWECWRCNLDQVAVALDQQ
ncbi:hypothetical protein ACFWOJ_38580 [Streptomyces sp. NPDC058439]|uniref:hypothetical protein n=1 Tax=Streptomyces sp. NPDC058439 TaxID=3346500 RepID=UPI00364EFA4C